MAQGKLRGQPAEGGPERIDLRTEEEQKLFSKQSSAGLAGEEVLAAASVPGGQRGRQSQLQPNGTQPPGGGPSGAGLAEQAGGPMLKHKHDPTWSGKSSHPWLEQVEQSTSEYGQCM